MTRICLVRHGETGWNRLGKLQGKQNTGLNSLGREQAEATGAYLKQEGIKFDCLITSSLQRAKETAEIINNHLQLPLTEMDELQERGFGMAEGMSVEEREQYYPDGNFPGMEREADFHQRVLACFEHIATNYQGKNILLVSHGLVINLILSVLSGNEVNYKQTELLNGCLNHLEWVEDGWSIELMNHVEHLDKILRG